MTRFKWFMVLGLFAFLGLNSNMFAQNNANNLSIEEQEQVEKLKKKFLHYHGYITFSNTIAQDNFMDALLNQNLGAAAPGFAIGGGAFISDMIPIMFGFDISFNFLESETKYYGSLYYRDTITSSASMIPFNIFMRIQPDLLYIQPYVEAFVGFTPITTSIEYKTSYNFQNKYSDGDTPFHLGFGAGISIPMVTTISIPDTKSQVLFDLSFKYFKGNDAKFKVYELEGSSYIEKDVVTDATDLIMMKAGVSFRF